MGTAHEGVAIQIEFAQPARAKAWCRGQLEEAQQPVQAVIDGLKARPLCDASIFSNPLELALAVPASEVGAVEKLLLALATTAGEKGAHAEVARFSLDGTVTCWVWDARKRKLAPHPPEAREVKRDYKLAQRTIRELVRIKAPAEAARPATALACPCGAAVQAKATRCKECQQSFTEPLGVKAAPGDAAAARHGRDHLQALGIAVDSTSAGSVAFVSPRNAGEWLEAHQALTRAGFTLLDAQELHQRVSLLQEAARWPRKYPAGEAAGTPGAWLSTVMQAPDARKRAKLEAVGREHRETLMALAQGLRQPDPGWWAAAQQAGVALDGLWGAEAQAAFSVILRLASPKERRRLVLSDSEAHLEVMALVRLAPDLLKPAERQVYLEDLEGEASRSASQVGAWLEAVQRVEGISLAEALRRALLRGSGPKATEEAPGLFRLVESVIDWAVEPSAIPRVPPLEEAGLVGALEALARKGFPPAITQRLRAAEKAAPPYGLKPLPAWAFPPGPVAKPTLKCPGCRASMKPKAALNVPVLTPKLGPRTIHVYECETCSAEEPSVEHVHITLGPGGRGKPSPGEAFLDAPDPEAAAQQRPEGFVGRRYQAWLETSGRPKTRGLQLGGHPHGVYSEEPLVRLSCRHAPTLLQFDPPALGMNLPVLRVATAVCLHPDCKRPGVAEEPVTY
jgi:hypothetical protein